MSIKTRTSGIMVNINVEPATAPVSATTWDPTQKSSHVSLDATNLISNVDTDIDIFGVRSIGSLSGGSKIYYEIVRDVADPGGAIRAGFCTSAYDFSGGPSLTPNELLGFQVNGSYSNPSSVDDGSAYTGFVVGAGDRIGIAYDVANARIWARRNGSDWNNNAANNPATNTGGYIVSIDANTIYAGISFAGPTEQWTVRFSSGSWQDSEPAGFTKLT